MLLIGLSAAELRLDGFGLAKSFGPIYFMGLGLATLGSLGLAVGQGRAWIVGLFGLALLVVVLWASPLILEGTPRFRTTYVSYGYVDALLRDGGLTPERLVYHNWPLFPAMMAALVGGLSFDPKALMALFPTVITLAYLAGLSLLLVAAMQTHPADSDAVADRRLGVQRFRSRVSGHILSGTSDRLHVAGGVSLGLWAFVVFNWTGQDYFSPQALAYLFYIMWLVVLARISFRTGGRFTPPLAAFSVLIFSLIVTTHVLTALVALGVLAALSAGRMVRGAVMFITCALIFFAWQAYAAAPFFEFYAEQIRTRLFAAASFLEENVVSRASGSPEHVTVVRLRILATVATFVLAGIAGVSSYRRPLPPTTRFAVLGSLGVAVVAPVTAYGGEMLIRVLLFTLPLLCMVLATMSVRRTTLLPAVIALALASPLHVFTHYGNELYDYVSPQEIAGWNYIAEEAPLKLYGAFPGGAYRNTLSVDWRNSVPPTGSGRPTLADYLAIDQHRWRNNDWPIFVAFSRGDAAAAELFYDRPGLIADLRREAVASGLFTVAYENDDISILRYEERDD